jgi:hypothetical protein
MAQEALLPASAIVAIAFFAVLTRTEAADVGVAPPLRVSQVHRVQDCSAFYNPYRFRGFGWGSGPGLGVGFGTFEGALPLYPANEFPNWYGTCVNWGHYSSTGSAPR